MGCPRAAIVMTSKSCARKASSVAADGRHHARQPRRFGAPSTTRVNCRALAYSSNASTAERTIQRHRFGAERFRQAQQRHATVAFLFREAQQRRRLDVHHGPFGIQGVGDALARANRLLGLRIGTGGHEHPIARQPAARLVVRRQRLARAATSSRSVMRRNASSRRAIRLGLRKNRSVAVPASCGSIDLAGAQPFEKVIRRQVDELDLVGFVENPVGQRFPLLDAGDLRDDVVETFEMLDVDGGPHVDAGFQQLFDVLPALGVPRHGLSAEEIRVRQLVDDQDGRTPRERRVEVEFLAHDVAVFHRQRRQLFEALHEPLRFHAPMRLDIADGDVDAVHARRTRGLQHRVGLADARGRAEENAQTAAGRPDLFCLKVLQQLIGIRPLFGHCLFRLHGLLIEREIQFQHIHARFAEEAEGAALGCGGNQLAHARRFEAPCSRHAAYLKVRGGRRDVRIESAAGRGDQIDRDGCGVARIGGAQRGNAIADGSSSRFGLVTAWLDPEETAPLLGNGPVADGRPQKYFGLLNG